MEGILGIKDGQCSSGLSKRCRLKTCEWRLQHKQTKSADLCSLTKRNLPHACLQGEHNTCYKSLSCKPHDIKERSRALDCLAKKL